MHLTLTWEHNLNTFYRLINFPLISYWHNPFSLLSYDKLWREVTFANPLFPLNNESRQTHLESQRPTRWWLFTDFLKKLIMQTKVSFAVYLICTHFILFPHAKAATWINRGWSITKDLNVGSLSPFRWNHE